MKFIPLTQGKFAKVDDDMFKYLNQWKWYFSNTGYAQRESSRKQGRRSILMHRVINNTPKGMETDHINMNRLDDQKENLRSCSHQENQQHKKIYKNNKSGYRGVTFRKDKSKWEAYIGAGGRRNHIGYFENAEEAARAFDEAARTYRGCFATTNFAEDSNA